MKVLCKKIFSHITGKDLGEKSPWLTVGNEYVILAMYYSQNKGFSIYIKTDSYGEPGLFKLAGFEFLSNHIPSCWITTTIELDGEKYINMQPKLWSYDSFFEEITEDEPKAVELFNHEVKKIYEEEELYEASTQSDQGSTQLK